MYYAKYYGPLGRPGKAVEKKIKRLGVGKIKK